MRAAPFRVQPPYRQRIAKLWGLACSENRLGPRAVGAKGRSPPCATLEGRRPTWNQCRTNDDGFILRPVRGVVHARGYTGKGQPPRLPPLPDNYWEVYTDEKKLYKSKPKMFSARRPELIRHIRAVEEAQSAMYDLVRTLPKANNG